MGQAFRRASGRIRAIDPSPKTAGDRRPPPTPPNTVGGSAADNVEIQRKTTTLYNNNSSSGSSNNADVSINQDNLNSVQDDDPRIHAQNILEERNPQFDAMLSQMVGRIRAKPGGKPEIGEAAVVERYNRPLPKVRNTKPDSGRYEERLAPPGTLNVAQLRHIMLLYQGKADDHKGAMDVSQIAEKFRLEVEQVQKFLRFLSLPPEKDSNKQSGSQ